MGSSFFIACNRCGDPLDESQHNRWLYQTKDKVWLHACIDGIMGGAKEYERGEQRPVLALPTRAPIAVEPAKVYRIYLVPGTLYFQRQGKHYVQCHGCPLEIEGDYGHGVAAQKKYNLFNCSGCGNWQEWRATFAKQGRILVWKLDDYSKIERTKAEVDWDLVKAVAIDSLQSIANATSAPASMITLGASIYSHGSTHSFVKDARYVSQQHVQPAARPR